MAWEAATPVTRPTILKKAEPRGAALQITRRGLLTENLNEQLDDLRREFALNHYVRLPKLFEPGLLAFIQQMIERGEFYERVHPGIKSNKELCLKENRLHGALFLLMNDENLFRAIQSITQSDSIGCFEGRVYRFVPGEGHHDAWHSDTSDDRLVALSINLSNESYCGGTLQIRDASSQRLTSEVPNVGHGDAIIFRISPKLQHRVTRVTGASAKTAFAGWFRAKPHFGSLLKGFGVPSAVSNRWA